MPEKKLLPRRGLLRACGGVAAAAILADPATAQPAWPSRPIRLIVPFAPGGSIDVIGRAIATRLSSRLGSPVVVENRGGAGGMTGTAYVAGQPPDGYTLLFTGSPFGSAPLLVPGNQRAPYDPLTSLQPIALVAAAPLMVTVSNDLRVTTLRELIDAARAAPQRITYGSGGVGSINHLSAELLATMADVQFTHVPFPGLGPAIAALLGGHLSLMLGSFPSTVPLAREGRVRALAVTGAQRSPIVPDVPTVAEAGIPGYELEAWWGMLGPVALPAAITERLNGEVNSLLTAPEMLELLARDGAVPKPGTPRDFGNMIAAELPRWRDLIRAANIRLE